MAEFPSHSLQHPFKTLGRARLLPSRCPAYRFRVYSASGGRHTECACYSYGGNRGLTPGG